MDLYFPPLMLEEEAILQEDSALIKSRQMSTNITKNAFLQWLCAIKQGRDQDVTFTFTITFKQVN